MRMEILPRPEVAWALLPPSAPPDRAWSARFLWRQAVTSGLVRRWGGDDHTVLCWLCAVDYLERPT